MSQNTFIFDDTLEKNISMSDGELDIDKINYLMTFV